MIFVMLTCIKAIPRSFNQFLRSVQSNWSGNGFVVLPRTTISQVLDMLRVILLSLSHPLIFLTSLAAESPVVFTGALTVKSSANLVKRLLLGSSRLISLTMSENKEGPMTVPYGTPLLISRKSVTIPSTTTRCFRLV